MKRFIRLALAAFVLALALVPAANPQAGGRKRDDAEGFALPAEAVARVGSARLRHQGAVRGLAYTRDSRAIVSLADDNTIRLWDSATGKLLRNTKVELSRHYMQALRMDGKTVDVVNNGIIYSFDPTTGKELRKILLSDIVNPHRGCFSADGALLALGFSGGDSISLRDPTTGKEKLQFIAGSGPHAMAFTPDRRLLGLLWPGSDAAVFFDMTTLKRAFELPYPQPNPRRLDISPDGTRAMTSSYNDPHHTLWDLKSRKRLCELEGEGRDWAAEAVAFSPDSRHVAIGGARRAVAVFDTTNGKEWRRFATIGECRALAFSADGNRLCAGNEAGEICQWDIAVSKPRVSADPPGGIRVRRFMNGGNQILAETDCLVHFDWKSGTVGKYPWDGEHYLLPLIRLSRDGKLLAVPLADPERRGMIALLDAQSGKEVRVLPGHDRATLRMVWSPDGKRLFTSGVDNMIRVWDAQSGKQLHEIEGVGDPGGPFARAHNPHEYLAVAPDGRRFATAAFLATEKGGHFLRVWDTASGKLLHQLVSKQRLSDQLAFSPAGDLLFALDGTEIGKGDVFTLIEPATGSLRWALTLNDTHAASIAFSADGQTLAIGGDDGTLKLYETATGRLRHAFTGHARAVDGLAFTPDGALLAASSLDAPVFLWAIYGKLAADRVPVKWSAEKTNQLWQDLASSDAGAALDAVRCFVQNPAEAVALLRARLGPVATVPEKLFQKLLRDLDSDDFELRQNAYNELDRLAVPIEFRLREAVTQVHPLEVRRRLEALIKKLDPITPERLRHSRAIEALEQIATPDALRFVELLAAGEPGARLTREAGLALVRLAQKE